jgi:hypothetical protein
MVFRCIFLVLSCVTLYHLNAEWCIILMFNGVTLYHINAVMCYVILFKWWVVLRCIIWILSVTLYNMNSEWCYVVSLNAVCCYHIHVVCCYHLKAVRCYHHNACKYIRPHMWINYRIFLPKIYYKITQFLQTFLNTYLLLKILI